MNEYVNDIPQGLARGAFGGVSMNPERRGDSARQEYADELAGDYEHFKEQATKGGTLDLLDTEFATAPACASATPHGWAANRAAFPAS
jgi:hypothetical protein